MADRFTDSEISNAIRLDQPLSSHKGPVARWQRKALETSSNNSFLNISGTKRPATSTSLTGSKRLNLSGTLGRTPNKQSKTPSKSPGRFDLTPGGTRRTPTRSDGADRFIPCRNAIDFEASRFLLQRGDFTDNTSSNTLSPSQLQFQKRMAESLCGTDMERSKIISFRQKAPAASEAHSNGLKVLYSQSPAVASKNNARHIPQAPDRILDAPDIVNDYYLNLLDWSCNNHLAVALGPHIYLWNAATGEIQQLMELEAPEDYVCSVKWIKEGNILAIGNSLGEASLWDVEQMKKIRTMPGHTDRIGVLSWNEVRFEI